MFFETLFQTNFHWFMFKEFLCPENKDKVPGVFYFSSDRPMI